MKKYLLTFPVLEKQKCKNCKIMFDINKLKNNVVGMNEDAYGLPAIMVRCPICKTLFEWETKCN